MHAVGWRAGDAITSILQARHPDRLVQRKRIARARAIAIRRHHDDFANDSETPRQNLDAGRIDAVVIAYEYSHAYLLQNLLVIPAWSARNQGDGSLPGYPTWPGRR